MKKTNCKIGFNDGMLMVIGIPFLSFIIPIVFIGCRFNRPPYFNLEKYFATLFITACIWIGNRYIMIYSRKKYPHIDWVQKRIFIQSLLMLLFTLVTNNIFNILLEDVFKEDAGIFNRADAIIHSNSASIFCTIMIIAIYESIYSMHELRQSLVEKEALKRESLHAQLDALKTQVNPHFLFNNLNTLSSLIPENPKHAVDFVQHLSKVYRYILEVKDNNTILLKEELDVLKAYVFLLQTRFGTNLHVQINIPEEKLKNRIVPLSLQILMENAIKHNIVSEDKPLEITIFCENDHIVLQNNLQMKKQLSESTGIGLDNIRNRYKLISDKEVKITETDKNFIVSIPLIDA